MFSRSFRKLIVPGFALLALAVIVAYVVAAVPQGGDAATGQVADPARTTTQAAPSEVPTAAVSTAAKPVLASLKASATAAGSKSASPSAAPGAATASSSPGSSNQAAGGVAVSGFGNSSSIVYGVSDPILITLTASQQIVRLEAMKAIGITSVRIDASWYWVQPDGPSSYDWASLDLVVKSITSVGLSADFIIDGAPAWAAVSGAAGNQFAQPASALQFATYAAAVAARYGPKGINYFEIWNEPNMAEFWLPKPDASAYSADLEAAYTAIKQVDSSAVVISGGLAPATNDGTDIDPRTFLEDMYSDGAGGSFDELGFHPYSYPDSPDQDTSWSGWSMMAQTSPSMRSIMAEHGDSGKQIWITEYGAPTSGAISVGDSAQSTDIAEAISQVQQTSWIGSLYLFTWEDDPSTDPDGFGLLTDTGSPKPAYSAIASALG